MFWNKKEYLVEFKFDSDKGETMGKVIMAKRFGSPKIEKIKESIKELIIKSGVEPFNVTITGINTI